MLLLLALRHVLQPVSLLPPRFTLVPSLPLLLLLLQILCPLLSKNHPPLLLLKGTPRDATWSLRRPGRGLI